MHSLYLTTLLNFILNQNNTPTFLNTTIDNSKFISIIYFVRIFKFIQNEYEIHEGLQERYNTSNKPKLKVLKTNHFKVCTYIEIRPFCTLKNQARLELQNCMNIDFIIKLRGFNNISNNCDRI